MCTRSSLVNVRGCADAGSCLPAHRACRRATCVHSRQDLLELKRLGHVSPSHRRRTPAPCPRCRSTLSEITGTSFSVVACPEIGGRPRSRPGMLMSRCMRSGGSRPPRTPAGRWSAARRPLTFACSTATAVLDVSRPPSRPPPPERFLIQRGVRRGLMRHRALDGSADTSAPYSKFRASGESRPNGSGMFLRLIGASRMAPSMAASATDLSAPMELLNCCSSAVRPTAVCDRRVRPLMHTRNARRDAHRWSSSLSWYGFRTNASTPARAPLFPCRPAAAVRR
jgi:hypothetical protein